MDPDIAIQCEGVSKRYVISHRCESDGLRHRLESFARNPLAWLRGSSKSEGKVNAKHEEFWALKDISFSIREGDVVGIVGRNGAGKSTLLKLLSRISEPTNGTIKIRGRVASLLEVGTGFHQELTGRENIFLNGAIMGMSKAEIRRKFDEIVAFSEVERFLDTPVKRYSSGMYVRLAFAVAAHLEPDVLIVDEVLAVGDAAFQKKCMGKMGEVAMTGRTVLFVSHNMAAVQALCSKAVYLKEGHVRASGDVAPILEQYLRETGESQKPKSTESILLDDQVELKELSAEPGALKSGQALGIKLRLVARRQVTIREMAILIFSEQNTRVAVLDLRELGLPVSLEPGAEWSACVSIREVCFVEGEYSIGLYVNFGEYVANLTNLTSFSVSSQPRGDHVPIPAMYRGIVELDWTGKVETTSGQLPGKSQEALEAQQV
jgi:lipopolysaccharide transport system ATP-binding protein